MREKTDLFCGHVTFTIRLSSLVRWTADER